ncbi:heavy metal resistance protein [Sphingomonas sp. Leaf412]|uniref:periplasmic heavy metal sensor n=1 Tax=Sphingomonas sp. Leaf412 TaxID=1736370 RepID=UPI0006F61044|nr:periplasmic heavy metal sensor [Sphingomonas sp. Leaf412]KQT35276.1 heavy metal resistance protein [Sphingomonas sp. Leaf412]
MTARRLWLTALVVFLAAVAGVFVGRHLFPAPTPPTGELHALLHDRIDLDPEQDRQLHAIERHFAGRRQALEAAMRAENARLARAIAAEHRIGPEVTAAIDASHRTMGALQKETLAHVFAMRRLLRTDQAATFDAAVMKALTEDTQ